MKFKVYLTAYSKKTDIRYVSVPKHKIDLNNSYESLEEIYSYGQNEIQEQQLQSVSMGDVIEFNNELFLIAPIGFQKISQEEFDNLNDKILSNPSQFFDMTIKHRIESIKNGNQGNKEAEKAKTNY